jgi:type I restriction enzyme R subunit
MLQQLLAKAIAEFKKVNRLQAINFTEQMQGLVARYNDRTENDVWSVDKVEGLAEEMIDVFEQIREEMNSFEGMGIDYEDKAFYDILKLLCVKYDFTYPEDKLLELAGAVRGLVADNTQYTDWNERSDIKAALKVGLILLLADHGYPPGVNREEVYEAVFSQAEGYRLGQRG